MANKDFVREETTKKQTKNFFPVSHSSSTFQSSTERLDKSLQFQDFSASNSASEGSIRSSDLKLDSLQTPSTRSRGCCTCQAFASFLLELELAHIFGIRAVLGIFSLARACVRKLEQKAIGLLKFLKLYQGLVYPTFLELERA